MTGQDKTDLDKHLTVVEMLEAVWCMWSEKTPGPVGIPIEVYELFMDKWVRNPAPILTVCTDHLSPKAWQATYRRWSEERQSRLLCFLPMILLFFCPIWQYLSLHLLVLSKFEGNIEHTTTWGLPLQSYPYSACIKKLLKQMTNPFVNNTPSVWHEAHAYTGD